MNTKTTMTDEEHEQLEARRKHGAKGMAYLPPADKCAHTPGPWIYDEGKNACHISTRKGTHIASVTMRNHFTPARANARLIAAAPELLEACKQCVSDGQFHDDTREILRAAIAAAEGRAQ